MTPSETPTSPEYAFLDRQLGLLGDRHPLEVLAETPDALRTLVSGHPEERLAERPEPGVWSPREILGHLIDADWVLGFRARTLRADPEPSLVPVDQELWVERQGWNRRTSDELLDLFSQVRAVTLDFWRGVSPEDLDRTGRHTGAGIDISLGLLCRIQAGHDLSHREQLGRYLGDLSTG